ncbi:MAG: acetyl-CoA carboxylase biotin carboxyl carrier protein subunit, partial [Bacteroidetes bacterium SW_10_40_5]
ENVLKAPADATISKIHVEKQDKVEKNQLIINFE